MTGTETDWAVELARHHAASFGWALACSGWNREEAEEILQAVYVKVLEGSARFGGRAGVKTWLFGVIRRTAAERRRRERRGVAGLRRLVSQRAEPEPESPERSARSREAGGRLVALLPLLSERQREVLHLVFYGDLSVEAAAGVMGVSLGSARTHYARGKRKLRELLAEEE